MDSNRQPSRRWRIRPPLGLRNLGNTCYINSVLQCLTFTPPFGDFCLRSRHSSICSLSPVCRFCMVEKRINWNLSSQRNAEAPFKIHNSISLFADHFKRNEQQDAHEFLRYVIDACSSCRDGDRVGGGESVVKEMFGGELRSQMKCASCGGESNKIDEIMDICLELFEVNSVEEAFQRFFDPEILEGDNKYKCEKCEKLVAAKKQMWIQKAPTVLVIQLKRFDGIRAKIDRVISYSECLVLSNYMCKESQDPHPKYNLVGTIVHSGNSPDSGHYYAYVKATSGQWYCCDDSTVSLSSLTQLLSEKVYILFFIRSNQRPRPNKSSPVANGVKPHSNGYETQKANEAVPSNSVETRPHGAQNSERIVRIVSKAEKPLLDPEKKCDSLNSSDSDEFHGNGNGNGFNNGTEKNHITLKRGRPEDISQDENSSTISGSKRKILDGVSNYCPSLYANQETHVRIIEKLREDAFSHLRSCDWYENVRGFIRAKKKNYAKSGGDTTNEIELKKVLIEEARQTFSSQVPAALKADLVSLVHSFHQKKQS